jgi:hypothetical protein
VFPWFGIETGCAEHQQLPSVREADRRDKHLNSNDNRSRRCRA